METAHDNHYQHPLLAVVAGISSELDKAATFNPTFVPAPDKADALRELSVLNRQGECRGQNRVGRSETETSACR